MEQAVKEYFNKLETETDTNVIWVAAVYNDVGYDKQILSYYALDLEIVGLFTSEGDAVRAIENNYLSIEDHACNKYAVVEGIDSGIYSMYLNFNKNNRHCFEFDYKNNSYWEVQNLPDGLNERISVIFNAQ